MKEKPCSTCQKVKALSEFSKRKDSKDGRRGQCKACHDAKKRKWEDDNREKIREDKRRWREAHREKQREYYSEYRETHSEDIQANQKKYVESHPKRVRQQKLDWYYRHKESESEKTKVYYQNNKERMLERQKEYRYNNKEKIQARMRKYCKKNRDQIRAVCRRHRENNRDLYTTYAHKRRAMKLSAPGSHTTEEWLVVKELFDFTCPCCGRSEPEIKLTRDHIIPLTQEGSDDILNIQPLCQSCNSSKNIKTMSYYSEEQFETLLDLCQDGGD